MFPITRSVSKYFEREKIPEEEREKMLEAAPTSLPSLLPLSGMSVIVENLHQVGEGGTVPHSLLGAEQPQPTFDGFSVRAYHVP